jgi:hypothetical protein
VLIPPQSIQNVYCGQKGRFGMIEEGVAPERMKEVFEKEIYIYRIYKKKKS